MLHQLDITREHCPMTFVKVKLKFSQMKAGEQVAVRLLDGEPLKNVPRTAQEQGYKVISVTPEVLPVYTVVIEK